MSRGVKVAAVSVCMAVTLTACAPIEDVKWGIRKGAYELQDCVSELFKTKEDKAEELSLTIMRHILSEDKEGLKELLAPELQEMEGVDEQLDTFFVLMGSKVTTFRSVETDSKTENLTYIISDIRTEEDKIYSIAYTTDNDNKITALHLNAGDSGIETGGMYLSEYIVNRLDFNNEWQMHKSLGYFARIAINDYLAKKISGDEIS